MENVSLQALHACLRSPLQHHPDAVIQGCTVGILLEIFELLPTLTAIDGLGVPASKNCVLHAAMFHALDGCRLALLPPPLSSAAARTPEFAATRTLYVEATRFLQRRNKLGKEESESFLSQPLTPVNCCLLKPLLSNEPQDERTERVAEHAEYGRRRRPARWGGHESCSAAAVACGGAASGGGTHAGDSLPT